MSGSGECVSGSGGWVKDDEAKRGQTTTTTQYVSGGFAFKVSTGLGFRAKAIGCRIRV